MFTYLSAGDLEKLVAAGGKKGKAAKGGQEGAALEKVEYMQRDEIQERQKKDAEERMKRRELVDGLGAGSSQLLNGFGMEQGGGAFEVTEDYHQKQGVSQFLAMLNGANADMDEDGGEQGYQRLSNGMGINENKKHLKKQTDLIS